MHTPRLVRRSIVSICTGLALAALSISLLPWAVSAQTIPVSTEQTSALEARIKSDDLVRTGKKIIFDASPSTVIDENTAEYVWDFGFGIRVAGKEVVREFTTPGRRTVTLTIRQNGQSSSISKDIFVFDKKALLILDPSKEAEMTELQTQAAESGVAVVLLPASGKDGSILPEEGLVQRFKENPDYIKDADVLVFYTQSFLGARALNLYWRDLDEETRSLLRQKSFVIISDGEIRTAANIAYQTFNIVEPEYILLSRKESLNPIFMAADVQSAIKTLGARGIEYRIVDQNSQRSGIFVLSRFVNSLVSEGVPSSIIYIILMIPFIAFIASFAKQVIGISTFGIYTPVIIAVSFFILGLKLGLVSFCIAVIVGYLVRYIVNRYELLYLPKVALNLSFISLSFLFVIWLALEYGTSVPLATAIFPMLVMSTVAEKFMAAQSEEGLRGAFFGVLATLLTVLASYYFVSWDWLGNMLLSWSEFVLVPVLMIVLLGKFTGLRLSEYLRFRSLLGEHEE